MRRQESQLIHPPARHLCGSPTGRIRTRVGQAPEDLSDLLRHAGSHLRQSLSVPDLPR